MATRSRSRGSTATARAERVTSQTETQFVPNVDDTTLNPGQPRAWRASFTSVSLKAWQQLLGLNPFKWSYFGLYRALATPSDRAVAAIGGICAIAAGVPLPVIGVIFGKIISSFPPSEAEITLRIGELLGVAVAYFVVTTIYAVSFGLSGERIAIQFRQKLLHSLMHLQQSYLDTHDIDINALLSEKVDTIQVGCSEKVGIFIQSISYFFAAFIVGFILNPKLTAYLLVAVIPTMAIIVAVGSSSIKKFASKATEHNEQATSVVESSLRAVKVVQAYDMIDRMCSKHGLHLKRSARYGAQKAFAAATQLGGVYFTAYSANALAFYVGSQMSASGAADGSSGTIYAVVFLILDASFVVGQFAPFLEIFARAASAYGEIQDLLEACNNAGALRPKDKVQDYDLHGQAIEFSNVSFAYPARPTVAALNGLDLTVQPGSFTAVVGTSGGGKSTLVSLLLGVYDYTGQIAIGDKELRDLDEKLIRSQIAVLDQECVLFSGTVFDNICHGLVGQELSEEEKASRCEAAAKTAAVDFLNELPLGIHTRIDNTLQLSGGQRQRICLARALVKNPAVLVLDEPTSALDANSEQKVMKGVKAAISNGTTVFMIAHRLSTVLDADIVAVVSDGRVVESGTPRELSQGDTVFKGLLDAQNTNLDAREEQSSTLHKVDTQEDGTESKDDESDANSTEPEEQDQVMRLRDVIAGIFRLSKPEHFVILIGLVAAMISGGIMLGEAIIFGRLVQLLNTGRTDSTFTHQADFDCLLFFILACIAFVSYISSGTAFGYASTRLTARIQGMLLRNVLQLDLEWFSGNGRSAHDLTSGFAKNAGDLSSLSGVALGTIFTVLTSVVGGIILAHVVAWKIAVVLLSAVPVMLLAGFTRLRMLSKSEYRHRTAYGSATGLAIEACRNRRTVAILGIETTIENEYQEALQKPLKEGFKFAVLCNTLLAFSFAVTYFVYALAYWWGSKQVRNGSYSQKDFFTVLPALLFSAQSSGQLFSLSPEIVRARTAASNIFQTLGHRPQIIKPESVDAKADLISPDTSSSSENSPLRSHPKVEFVNVSFTYFRDSEQNVLQDVSFSVKNGQTVAFVGPSGAGKSSTISLIERFYDPSEGSILFDGVDIRTTDVRKLRDRVSLVPQEPELFPGTVKENIALGAASEQTVTMEDIERVARQCGLHDFIASLPEAYNTDCGSVGSSQLSGGQRQRLALARALIRNPEVLLLDEPTSALDAHSERRVQAALEEASKGRTTITVAHRLASIRQVDKIIVFDHGKAVEQGSHTELMELGGLYASMAKAQALA